MYRPRGWETASVSRWRLKSKSVCLEHPAVVPLIGSVISGSLLNSECLSFFVCETNVMKKPTSSMLSCASNGSLQSSFHEFQPSASVWGVCLRIWSWTIRVSARDAIFMPGLCHMKQVEILTLTRDRVKLNFQIRQEFALANLLKGRVLCQIRTFCN